MICRPVLSRPWRRPTSCAARTLVARGDCSPTPGLHGIRLVSLHDRNEMARVDAVLAHLAEGRTVAVVSDAGTPAVSDPGARLVSAAVTAGATVSVVPGPSAALAALVVSGLPTDRFCFEGFLPRRGAHRRGRIEALAREARTVVLFEAPGRLAATLGDLRGGVRARSACRGGPRAHEAPRGGVAGDARRRRRRLWGARGAGRDRRGGGGGLRRERVPLDEEVVEALQSILGAGATLRERGRDRGGRTGHLPPGAPTTWPWACGGMPSRDERLTALGNALVGARAQRRTAQSRQ